MLQEPYESLSPDIFISGPSRSGTALVRSILNNHPDIALAGETHYFDHLRTELGGDRLLGPEELERAIRYFTALTHRPYGHGGVPGEGWLDAERFHQCLPSEVTGDDVFAVFTSLHAARFGASRAGEKTPRHVFRIDDILTAFPQARMIVTVRDPRAVAASYRSWTKQGGFDLDADPEHRTQLEREAERAAASYHPVVVSVLWRLQMMAGAKALNHWGDHRVRLVRYEDLVSDTRGQLEGLMTWLGLSLRDEQLDIPILNSSFEKFDSAGGIHTKGLDRWREVLPEAEAHVVTQIAGRLLSELGYERTRPRASLVAVSKIYASSVPAVVRATLANRNRMGSLPEYVIRRVRNLVD